MEFKEIFDQFIYDELISAGKSKKTEETYITFAKHLTDYFGDNFHLEKINLSEIRDWRDKLSIGRSPDTVRGYVICLRQFLNYCTQRDYIDINVSFIKVPKREKRLIKYLKDNEIQEFIAEVGKPSRGYNNQNRLRNIAVCEVLYSSGLRIDEICRLNKDSIKDRQMTVIGKSREPRIVFISKRAEVAITEYLALRGEDHESALFINAQNGNRIRPDGIRKIFRRVCTSSKFSEVHPHTFRHSFASHLVSEGIDIIYVSDLLGHQDLNTTKIYTHYENPKLKAEYEKVF